MLTMSYPTNSGAILIYPCYILSPDESCVNNTLDNYQLVKTNLCQACKKPLNGENLFCNNTTMEVCYACMLKFTEQILSDPATLEKNESYISDICNETYTSKEDLKSHSCEVHNSGKSFVCHNCKEVTLHQFYEIHGSDDFFFCHVCKQGFMEPITSNQHKEIHIEKQFICEQANTGKVASESCFRESCFRKVASEYKEIHAEKLFICVICKHTEEVTSDQHKGIHDDKPFVCDVCKVAFIDTSDEHKNIYSTEKLFICDVCKQAFAERVLFDKHKEMHNEKPFVCQVCEQTFTEKITLDQHKKIHSDRNSFKCKICQKILSSYSDMAFHPCFKSRDESLVCYICKLPFADDYALNRHMRVHSGKEMYPCKICHILFTTQYFLDRHEFKIHRSIGKHLMTPYICKVCKKRLSTNRALLSHLCTHTGEKPYVCKLCNKAFSDRGNWKIHLSIHIHREHSKYVCNMCEKEFRYKSNYDRHRIIVNQDGNSIVYCKTLQIFCKEMFDWYEKA